MGRLRYLNLDFLKDNDPGLYSCRVLRSDALRALRKLRRVDGDKRTHGHLFLLAGSRSLGGAAMMAAQGALKAGWVLSRLVFQNPCMQRLWHKYRK